MTRWTIRLFGPAREAVGARETEVHMEGRPTARALLETLAERHPALEELLPRSRVAVDREYVGPETPLEPGAEIAILPPVGGG